MIPLMKRIAAARRLLRPNSARYVAAKMPNGVPIAVASKVIIALPAMALAKPPASPGAGVGNRNRAG